MIKLTNTPKLTGISIHGNYEEFHQLYDALKNYLDHYYSTQYETLKEDLSSHRISEQEERITRLYLSDTHDCLTGLNCSIRRSWTEGTSVRLLYPWALYYLFQLLNILERSYDSPWTDRLGFPYTPYEMRRDRTVLQLFTDLLWISLKECLGAGITDNIYWFYENAGEIPPQNYLYCESICHSYITQTSSLLSQKSLDVRKLILTVLCYEILGSQMLQEELPKLAEVSDIYLKMAACKEQYESALDRIFHLTGTPMVTYSDFSEMLGKAIGTDGNTASKLRFINDTFGETDWKRLTW